MNAQKNMKENDTRLDFKVSGVFFLLNPSISQNTVMQHNQHFCFPLQLSLTLYFMLHWQNVQQSGRATLIKLHPTCFLSHLLHKSGGQTKLFLYHKLVQFLFTNRLSRYVGQLKVAKGDCCFQVAQNCAGYPRSQSCTNTIEPRTRTDSQCGEKQIQLQRISKNV